MFDDPEGPIEHFSWGKFIIYGEEHSEIDDEKTGAGKDICVIGKSVTEWKEREGHRLLPSMITGIYGQGIEVLVIGIGVNGLIECPDEVKNSIKENGINELILEKTPDACRTYNNLFHKGRRVALLAHGTC